MILEIKTFECPKCGETFKGEWELGPVQRPLTCPKCGYKKCLPKPRNWFERLLNIF